MQSAVCFFTEPGRLILSRHQQQLNLPDSYFIASVSRPTNLDALARLHYTAPGHVYIHLGGTTPEEKKVGRSLMHSKLFLAEGLDHCRAWVGSHNLTGMAIAGGNFEAGVVFEAEKNSQVIQDVKSHLEACRITAEKFDPAELNRYREIQKSKASDSEWDTEKDVLILHAEAEAPPRESPFTVHLHLFPVELDACFRMERSVRLFVHPPGSLRSGSPVDYDRAEAWKGEITAVVRTERHPNHRGTRGNFPGADFEVTIRDLQTIPKLMRDDGSKTSALTQVIMRIEERLENDKEAYSTSSKSPVTNEIEFSSPLEMHQVEKEIAKYFTPESIDNGKLVYRPALKVYQRLSLEGYEETMMTKLSQKPPQRKLFQAEDELPDEVEPIRYLVRPTENEIEPFLFLSRHVIRERD
ncbi:hypothetical protein [uncultured Rubinisphaera sp.]|uniref:hypothetical protein n=1 Tax=uncultured Rubinisphaera sp. TaxID=1678686 RepID=UPI0030DB64AF